MNNLKKLGLGLLTAATLLGGVSPAEARPNRIVSTTTSDGTYIAYKPIGRSGVEVLVTNDYTETGFIANMNCATGAYQWRANDGYSEKSITSFLVHACNL